MSGPYANYSGKGSVEAARMAAEDFGGAVLGRPIEVVVADHQNKPDVASSIARQWYAQGVNVILDVPLSSAGLAVQEVARNAKRVVLFSNAAAASLNGSACSPYGVQWSWDTYALTKGVADALVRTGAKTWFFLTSDYATGHAMQADLTRFVTAAGGTVVGAVRHPVGNKDFASFLLQAQSSGADVIALANAGEDTTNAIKQAGEFGLTESGQRLAVLFMAITQMPGLGSEAAKGLAVSTAFVWDRTPQTTEWSRRFFARTGAMPSDGQVSVYPSLSHYLKAAAAARTDDADAVMAMLRELPVNDVFASGGRVTRNGQMVHDMYLVEGKAPADMQEAWDYQRVIRTVPGAEAFRPLSESECPLVASR